MLKNIIGILLIVTGLFDAYKYVWQGRKIIKTKTAKTQSRKFVNISILNTLVRIVYAIVIVDFYILCIGIFASACMSYLFYVTYIYYPYRRRGLNGFKRPNVFLYALNSLMPNRIRKRL